MSAVPDIHLDLGCGPMPRNPYRRGRLYGIDLRSGMTLRSGAADGELLSANLVLEPIPFADDFFGSVSAYDFLEHVPRQLIDPRSGVLRNPFVELMSEIWRVLAPGGRLLASTPAYPRPEAFQDPTHVNIITRDTHDYFCGDPAPAAMYGFRGGFRVVEVGWSVEKNSREPLQPRWRKRLRNWNHRLFKQGLSHFAWELEAIKRP